jgi:hypothetical protein
MRTPTEHCRILPRAVDRPRLNEAQVVRGTTYVWPFVWSIVSGMP